MENVSHKYHAEVKSKDCLIRINVFSDELQSLFKDLDVLYEYMDYEQSPVLMSSRGTQSRGDLLPDPQSNKQHPAPANKGNGNGAKSACPLCGAVGCVEVVKWNDKNTGQPRQAPKCRSCNKWLK